MVRSRRHNDPVEGLLNRKILKIRSSRGEADTTLPSIHLEPSSFIEFIKSTVEPIFTWDRDRFGVVRDGVFYWTEVEGVGGFENLVKFYKIAGERIDDIPGENFSAILEILRTLGLKNLEEMERSAETLDYGLSTGIVEVIIDGTRVDSWDSLRREIFEGRIGEVKVEKHLELSAVDTCRREGIGTFDECLLRRKYDMGLEDFPLLLKVPDIIPEDVELYESPRIEGNRVVIGRRGYSDVYLADLFAGMDAYVNTLREFKRLYGEGKVRDYDEFLLYKKKQYTLKDLEDMVEEGLVRVKIDGDYEFVTAVERNNGVHLVTEKGGRYALRDLLRSDFPADLVLPLPKNYRDYKASRYGYYVEWKMVRNSGRGDDRGPRNLDELKRFISLGLVSVGGKRVRDLIVEGRQVFFLLEDGTRERMYRWVAQKNDFEIYGMINGKLSWIRRFLAEGFNDPDAIRLVLAIKSHELSRKNVVSIKSLSEETGISVERLGFYLTSDRFKRFGELRDGQFYLHPDIEEFKRNVKVRKDEDYEVIVVDGRNVLYGGEEKQNKPGKVENIIIAVESLKKRGVPEDRIIVILKNADFNRYRVDDLEKLRELERAKIVHPISSGYDDMEILRIALEERNGLIITRDHYREFIGGNITEEDIEKRRIEYTFRGRQFNIRRQDLQKLEKFIEKFKRESGEKKEVSSGE